TNLSHNLVLVSMTLHVCIVYASGALYKAGGEPWQQGYAIYNPLHVTRFGPWPELSDLLTTFAPMVTVISWSSIIIQMCFPMMLLNRISRVIGLFGILSFHIGIAILMGLPWFSLAMIAIDSIFIRDVTWRRMADFVRDSWRNTTAEPEPVEPSVEGPSADGPSAEPPEEPVDQVPVTPAEQPRQLADAGVLTRVEQQPQPGAG
ncbi:MAG TPA: HTTM domain-containing protein, partial [Microlunatus sp.]|nr:HTTM domain-containing protein [Microlunatus sp.]